MLCLARPQSVLKLFSFETRMQQLIEFICGLFDIDDNDGDNDDDDGDDDADVIRSASLLMELI